jgi:hypothetical protein
LTITVFLLNIAVAVKTDVNNVSGGVDCTHNTLADCINACNACSISDINVVCSVAAVGYDLEIYHDNLFCADGTNFSNRE